MTANRVILILGSGPKVGASVAANFASNGYKVAVASRSGTGSKTAEGYLSLKADLFTPASVPPLFAAIQAEFHTAPSVVVYNAAALTVPPVADSLFSVPAEKFDADLNINSITPYVAAQQAVGGWASLPNETPKTFIYTGNILNRTILPRAVFLTAGAGKSAAAYWVGLADTLYGADGYRQVDSMAGIPNLLFLTHLTSRFFYADERHPDGAPRLDGSDGEAHAEFFAQLASHEESKDVPWEATFVKGKGYVSFK
jgi:NAD(P)-dependent dehydrogenase (short-subunit alcohol dehydrogenase family)